MPCYFYLSPDELARKIYLSNRFYVRVGRVGNGFCETFFHQNISNDSLNINGFVQERKDRTENCGGGWLAYILENLEYKRKLDLERSNIETMWLEIKPCHKRSFLLCFVYRKPSELVKQIDKFESKLNNAISFNILILS